MAEVKAPGLSSAEHLEIPRLGTLVAQGGYTWAKFAHEKRVPAGECVVTEGALDRAMYWIIRGTAEILQGQVALGELQVGAHFGELGLLSERPRAASVYAKTELTLLELSVAEYHRLVSEEPQVAVALLEAVVGGVGDRLAEMTHSFKNLLAERSLPRRRQLTIQLGAPAAAAPAKTLIVSLGTRVSELLPEFVDNQRVVAGLINRKAVALNTRLSSDCVLSPLLDTELEGQRIYRMSLGLLLLEASTRVPGLERVRLSNSVGLGQRLDLGVLSLGQAATLSAELERQMHLLAAADQELREEWWTVDEARSHFEAAGWPDIAELLTTWRDPAVPLVSYGSLYTLRLGPLLPRTSQLSGFQIVPSGTQLVLAYGATREDASPPESDDTRRALTAARQSKKMTRNTDAWLKGLQVTSVGAFNAACIRGEVDELIAVSEGFHEKHLGTIADRIRGLGRRARVVTIAGPSSSGKSTFIKRLRVQLRVNGIRPVQLSLDDYYTDREHTPRDESGDYDFEALSALKLDLLRDHVARLLAGECVRSARYDFVSGRSFQDGGQALQLGERGVLLLEGIHGLNPGLLPDLSQQEVFRVFVCPLAQLPFDRLARVHGSDVRLLRRIVRDRHTRGINAGDNITRWTSVRRGERRWIFPFQDCADATFDTSLPYEMGVLKVYAERYLLEVPTDHPAHTAAFRLLRLLDRFVAIYPDRVPPNSLLREFIGGSLA
ncbi:MAG: hypothetical protein RJA70_2299 [Pseudomonadota bacterium]|jgi:uridine kinase